MSRYYCHDDYEHRREAERDARHGTRDYEMYDRYSSDECKRAYVDAYDCERDKMAHEQERREAEEARDRHAVREQREWEEYQDEAQQYYAEQEYPEEPFPEEPFETTATGDDQ